jgi:hypothetical protein
VAETLTLRTEIAKPSRGMQRVAGLREAATPPRSLRGCLLGQRVGAGHSGHGLVRPPAFLVGFRGSASTGAQVGP